MEFFLFVYFGEGFLPMGLGSHGIGVLLSKGGLEWSLMESRSETITLLEMSRLIFAMSFLFCAHSPPYFVATSLSLSG